MSDKKDQPAAAAPAADELCQRARDFWHGPLSREQWQLPLFLVEDLGAMLLRPDARLLGGHGVESYRAALRDVVGDESFRQCAEIARSVSGQVERQDEVVRTVIRGMTRQVRGIAPAGAARSPELCERVARGLSESLQARQSSGWLGPVDMVAVRAAGRLMGGPRLLDYRLLDECLRPWPRVPRHELRTRRAPVRREGVMEISRRSGEISGYTGVRPRLPTDPWTSILPHEWALMKWKDPALPAEGVEKLALDRILNRPTLVNAKESPYDEIPQLQVLVVFVIDGDPSVLLNRGIGSPAERLAREGKTPPSAYGKALAHRMILDAAEQVPFREMAVHVAVYLSSMGTSLPPRAACFDLRSLAVPPDPGSQVLAFDELVPFFFSYSHLQSPHVPARPGPWPELAHDPYTFMAKASAASSTYTSVLAVLVAHSGRWEKVLPAGDVPLRVVEQGRDCLMLVDHGQSAQARSYRYCGFPAVRQASAQHAAAFRDGSDVAVRNAFLNMLLGPAPGAVRPATSRAIVFNRPGTAGGGYAKPRP